MITLLLIIIYMAFISLGLPDSMLGAAWPTIREELSLPMAGAGLVAFIISGGTIISSLLSGILIKKLGTGRLTLISVFMTAVSLLGFSFSRDFLFLCLLAIPMGLGGGAVDAGLNNFVALHYSARHMSWLHCFWGVGATAGPIIMSAAIVRSGNWHNGYLIVAIIQLCLVLILFLSLSVWNKFGKSNTPEDKIKDIDVKDNDIKDNDIKDSDIKDNDVKDIDVRYIDVKDIDVRDIDVIDNDIKDIDVRDIDVIDNDIKDIDVRDIDVIDNDIKDIDIKDNDIKDIDIKDIDLKDIDVKDIDAKDIDVKDIDVKDNDVNDNDKEINYTEDKQGNVLKLPGIFPAMIGFFCYCALELTVGLWGSSYLVQTKGIAPATAAGWVSMYYLGITIGRFINGLFTLKFSNPVLIRSGQILIGIGVVILLIFDWPYTAQIGLILIGLGCAPIYPSMLHETPVRFGKNNSSTLMGLQMAFAYVGSTTIPPVIGLVMGKVGMQFYPVFIFILLVIMIAGSERVNRIVK